MSPVMYPCPDLANVMAILNKFYNNLRLVHGEPVKRVL